MRGLTPIHLEPSCETPPTLTQLINRLGSADFHNSLFQFIAEASAAEHCGVYLLNQRELQKYGAFSRDGSGKSGVFVDRYVHSGYWRSDPTMEMIDQEAHSHNSFLIEVDTASVGATRFKEELFLSQRMHHRLMVCVRMNEGLGVLDLVRSPQYGPFLNDELMKFGGATNILMPLVLKHCEMINQKANSNADAFKDLNLIESRLAHSATYLPPRERQVAARILYGQSTLGIALDLKLTEHTVSTYRKRLYGRLKISAPHELFRWFLRTSENCAPSYRR